MNATDPSQAARRSKNPSSSIPGTAVQVCVDFADVLTHTIPKNRPLFDNFVIVTAPHDIETQEICRAYDVELVVTDRFWRDGAFFNKAAGLNEGLRRAGTDLICSVDADTVLPNSVVDHVTRINDRESLYGMARKIHLTHSDYLNKSGEIRATAHGYTIGFFQLFWRSSACFPGKFDESYLTAAHYDIEFMSHWPINQRIHLDGLLASHLGPRQVNWFGRYSYGAVSAVNVARKITDARAAYDRFIGKITAMPLSQKLLVQNVGSRPGTNVIVDVHNGSNQARICLGDVRGGGFVELPMTWTGTSAVATLHWSDDAGARCCLDVPVKFR
jgi:hypothetical protein